MTALKRPKPGRSKVSRESSRPWYLYLLGCADGTTYIGITTDPFRRLKEHNAGRAARYTSLRKRHPILLLGVWRFADRASATRAEVRFKRYPAGRKRKIASTQAEFEDAPFCPGFLECEEN